MLRKLSRKFTVMAVTALFFAELIMVLLINGLNVYFAVTQADEVIAEIAENNGKIPTSKNKPDNKPDSKGIGDKSDKELEKRNYIVQYFTAVTDENGNVTMLNTGHFPSVTSDEAEEYAETVYAAGKESGFYDSYNLRYRISDYEDGSMIIFYDFSTNYHAAKLSILVSTVTAVALLAAASLLILAFSRRAVRPIISNQEKQVRFITDAGHELKTPLAIIRADTEVIEMTSGESEWTKSIVGQTDRLSDLLNSMLMLAKSQEIQRNNFEEINLSKLVKKVSDDFSPYCLSKKKPLEASITSGIYCMGDRKMLEMMLSVLLENAVKYGLDEKVIELSLTTNGRAAKLAVSNLCSEIPEGDLNQLFDRFYRGDSSRTRETGGSGIGLSIAKSTAEAHKGKITCTAEGSRIIFTFKVGVVRSGG